MLSRVVRKVKSWPHSADTCKWFQYSPCDGVYEIIRRNPFGFLLDFRYLSLLFKGSIEGYVVEVISSERSSLHFHHTSAAPNNNQRFYIIDFAAFTRIQMIPEQLQVLQNSSVRVPGVLPLQSFAPVFPRNLLPASGRESWHGWPSGLVWLTHGSPSLPSRAGIAVRRGTGRDGAGEAKGSHRLANQQGSIKCLVEIVLQGSI